MKSTRRDKIIEKTQDIADFFDEIYKDGMQSIGMCSEMKYDGDALGFTPQDQSKMLKATRESEEDYFSLDALQADIDALEKTSTATPRVTIPPEFGHYLKVLQAGIDKGYEPNGWLNDKNSPRMSHKENHDSMFHHLAESFNGAVKDGDSGIHPLLHLATRALMGYTRYMRKLESDRE